MVIDFVLVDLSYKVVLLGFTSMVLNKNEKNTRQILFQHRRAPGRGKTSAFQPCQVNIESPHALQKASCFIRVCSLLTVDNQHSIFDENQEFLQVRIALFVILQLFNVLHVVLVSILNVDVAKITYL